MGGSQGYGIDADFMKALAAEIKEAVDETGAQIAVVIGGGNIARGAEVAKHGVEEVTGHYMGMLGGTINGLAFADMLESVGQKTGVMAKLQIEDAAGAEPYNRRIGKKILDNGRVLVLTGGTGNPFFSHDSAAVLAALELDCQAVLKATKVEGVYDKDPIKHKGAKKHDSLTHAEALQNSEINVMDNAAISLAMDNKIPIVVFNLNQRGNVKKVIQGEPIGTRVSS